MKTPSLNALMTSLLSAGSSTLGLAVLLTSPTLVAATMTDAFSARPVATGDRVVFEGSSLAAGVEIDEPGHGGSRRRTLWAGWRAPERGGRATVETLGSDFDTVLAVYRGDALRTLVPVVRGDDVPGADQSRVTFVVNPGDTYALVVDGRPNTTRGQGRVALTVSLAASEDPGSAVGTDDFASRPWLGAGLRTIGVANTDFASVEPFEPRRVGRRGRTVWWRWVAPVHGLATIETLGSDFDTVVTVYAGSGLESLSEVVVGDDVPNAPQSQVQFQARAGLEYQILVDGQPDTTAGNGNVELRLGLEPNARPEAVPGADAFARRGHLEGRHAAGVAANVLFGLEAFEPVHGSRRGKTAWWSWTAPASGPVRMSTQGSDFETHLVVYRGNTLRELALVAGNGAADRQATWSAVQFEATRGVTYAIAVDGGPDTTRGDGNIVLAVDQADVVEETLAIYPAAEVEIPGVAGVIYQLQASTDLIEWVDLGEPRTGAGVPIRVLDAIRGTPNRFYRCVELQR